MVFRFALAIGGAALAQTPSPNEKKTISITWLGHAAFEIVSPGGTHLLIDPFLTKNPATPAENKDLTRYHPSHILVTHSHGDHLGDAVELAKLSKANKPQLVIGASPGSSSEADIRAVVRDDARVKFMKPGETRKF